MVALSVTPMTHPLAPHPLLARVGSARDALVSVAALDPALMPTREKASALLAIGQVVASALALQARLLASASDVAEDAGARDAASWLSAQTHADAHDLRRVLALGRDLERSPLIATALAEGSVDATKARVMLHALDELPDAISSGLRDQAEAALVSHAPELSPRALARLGRHLDAVVDPVGADAAEAKALLREERTAYEKTCLRLVSLFDGTCRISGVLPDSVGLRLRTYLDSVTQPRKLEGEACRPDQRLGRAFCDLLEHLDPAVLPDHGGDATAVMVTIPLAELQQELGAGALGGVDADQRISASEARRLACTAGIIPVVLGARSQVLDLGRAQRLFTSSQRKALRTQQSTCQAHGCDVPSTWCDAHHETPWSVGGRTDLNNALLLCGHHHCRVHDPRYVTSVGNGGVRIRLRR